MQIRPRHHDPPTGAEEQASEWALCAESPIYFIAAYCWVFNATDEAWIPFDLWPAQAWALTRLMARKLVVILKARQLGFTWLILGYALWQMLFRPAATIGIFSRTETDAGDLLAFRLKGMYDRLPAFMHCRAVLADNMSRWALSNGSVAMAFPTTGGRQYTFSFLLADEADFQEDLPAFMRAVKPTVDAGGAMVLLSTADKGNPGSLYKQIYRAAKRKANTWLPLFLPWYARPGRTATWYADQQRDELANKGSLDDLYQEYPATDTEALAPRSLDKRILSTWIEACYVEEEGDLPDDSPSLPGLVVYRAPQLGRLYAVGVDPAEGNPTSDDSALTVLDVLTGEEVAVMAGKYQPSEIAAYADQIGRYYGGAGLMIERNNHGHAVLLWLEQNSRLRRLDGHDEKSGWLSSKLGKTLLYNELADCFRDRNTTLHSFDTYTQLASIEGATLRAPTGEHDDRADSYALAHAGRAAMMKDTANFKAVAGAVNLFGNRNRASKTTERGGRHGRR
ncbi:MAG: hypothetical protein E6Q97_14285 [Desulfurellales bacterium]|nr:MAG: hypothetical protein E6Q97_14285 [Desulfurellales bacterium]